MRFKWYPAPAARTVGCFTPSFEAKSASESGVPTPSCSERAACALSGIQLRWLALRV
ncbi:hypothetical protein [Bacillus cereus group sp. BfR-BA-01331]|uniref:hypothetical protein n=1 Tax=Bacillus cereus group sp. BfR-BA-01331 TaxID=2920307 RepID=UPI001F5A8B00|nr:hypothetical protein [Bacillus cereus group sp. BfR-BA-01331]